MTDNHTNIILEDINGKLDLVLEAVAPIKGLQSDMGTVKEDIAELKADVKVVKAVVTSQSHSMNDYDKRIARLEAAKYHA
jgi:hypothetical protein